MLLMICSNTITPAQDESLQLSVRHTWGYSGFNKDINGHFSFSVRGPANLQRVQYLLDGDVVLEVSEPPFRFKLNTNDYQNGIHTLKAVGILRNGARISSKDFTREFVPPVSGSLFCSLCAAVIF